MTPTCRFRLTVSIVCALTMTSCAASRPTSAVVPVRLTPPEMATRPCDLHRLPEQATQADLEIGYVMRGAQIVACDTARRLAVETLKAERAAQAAASP
jgi:hypothetical protein